MKNLFVVVLLLVCLQIQAQERKVKFYEFETAIIEYTYEGNETGKQMLYLDDYGWRQSEWTNTVHKAFGQKTEKKEIKVTDGIDIWQWSPITKMGTKTRNTVLESMLEDPSFDPQIYAKKLMESLGFNYVGSEEVKGKNCDIYKGPGSTIWVWNGIAMKTEIKILGQKTVWTATKMETNVTVPLAKFDIPNDIRFGEQQSNDPMELMMKAMEQEGQIETDEASQSYEEEEDPQATETEEPESPNLNELKKLFKKPGKR